MREYWRPSCSHGPRQARSGPKRSSFSADTRDCRARCRCCSEALLEPGRSGRRSTRRSTSGSACSLASPTGSSAAEDTRCASVELAEGSADDALRAAARSAASRSSASTPASRVRSSSRSEAHALAAGRIVGAARRPEPSSRSAHILVWSCRLRACPRAAGGAPPGLERARRAPRRDALWYLALVELRAGNLALAGEYAERAREHWPLSTGATRTRRRRDLFPLSARRRPSGRARAGARARRADAAVRAEHHAAHVCSRRRPMPGVVELWSGDADGRRRAVRSGGGDRRRAPTAPSRP